MSSEDATGFFTPTDDDLDILVGEVLIAAIDGTWPLYMIDAVGVPYFGYTADGREFEACPWLSAIDRFVAVDQNRRIHWMHPAMRARVAALEADDFYREIFCEDIIPGLSRRETAEALADHGLSALLRLARRQRVAGPLYARIRRLGLVGAPAAADARLRALFAEAGINAALGWSIAQIALQAPRTQDNNIPVRRCPVTRAAILSRLTDPAATPRPDLADARRSLIALMIAGDEPEGAKPEHVQPDHAPSGEALSGGALSGGALADDALATSDALSDKKLSGDVLLVAAAIAHGVLSIDLTHAGQAPVSSVDLTIGRIERGDFDPRETPETTAGKTVETTVETTAQSAGSGASTLRPDWSPSPMEMAVIDCLFAGPPATAHSTIRLLGAANKRLCALGVEARVDLETCKRAFEEGCEVPF